MQIKDINNIYHKQRAEFVFEFENNATGRCTFTQGKNKIAVTRLM